jgi:hypothetical protein
MDVGVRDDSEERLVAVAVLVVEDLYFEKQEFAEEVVVA